MRIELSSQAPSSHPNQQIITPKPGSTKLQAFGTHVSTIHIIPKHGSKNTGFTLQAKGRRG